jgi:hypothetical protein
VVNLVMGALRVKLWHFTLGTFIGMLPGMLAATVLSDQLAAAIEDRARVNGWLIAAALLAVAPRLLRAQADAHQSAVAMASLTIASYNVHRAIGRDAQRCAGAHPRRDRGDPARRDRAAGSRGARHGGDMLAWLGAEDGLHAIAGTTLMRHDGHYGNGMLSRCPVKATALCDLSWRRREPRGAIAADVDCGGRCCASSRRTSGCGPRSAASRSNASCASSAGRKTTARC